jgi:hypothetical protein
MVNNRDRADWAETALSAFAEACMPGPISEETVMDLICNLGHYAELILGQTPEQSLRNYSVGIGAWRAEAEHSEDDPMENYRVVIGISKPN